MEIIHLVLGKANPERMNGVSKVVHALATHQAEAGTHVSVWGLAADLHHNYEPRNYATRLFLKSRQPFLLPKTLVQAVKSIRQPVVFHLHGGFLPQMYRLSRLLKAQHIPYVFTPHGSYNTIAMEQNKRVKQLYTHLFEKALLRHAGAIHVLGESEQESLRHWSKAWNIVRIPYGYECSSPVKNTASGQGDFVVGFCGRIAVYTKGLDALIEGFFKFHKEVPESKLYIIGDGEELPGLVQMVDRNAASEAVCFYGAKYGADKNRLLQLFDVFAHPSRNEGLPTAVLEAAAAGIPCLVTKATNTGDMVQQFNAGVVIEKTDALQMYEGLKALHQKIRIEKTGALMGSQAQQMIAEAFNWKTLLKSYDNMYLNLLA